MDSVNYLAVVVSTVVAMGLGFVWYQPSVFGNYWSKLTGRKMSDMRGSQNGYLMAALGALVMSWVLAVLLNMTGATTLTDGLKIGFLVWLGFSATTGMVNAVFSGRARNLYLLEQGHHLVVLLVVSAILVSWK